MIRRPILLFLSLLFFLAAVYCLIVLGTLGEPGTGIWKNVVNVSVNWRSDYIVIWW